MRYTIQITYPTEDPITGKQIIARSVFWVNEAKDIEEAYKQANLDFQGQKVKFGAIILGHHNPF